MTTTETTFHELQLESLSPADAVYADLQERRQMFDEQFGGLEGYGIIEPSVAHWEEYAGRHEHVAVDISDFPGGAFKYVSALGGALTLSENETTVVAATAGNFGGTLAHAAKLLGLDAKAYTPEDLNAAKFEVMDGNGMEVLPHFDDVAQAIPAAIEDCNANPDWAFLHPFNNPNGIAALTLLTDQVITNLLKMEADGLLELRDRDVKFPVQRGGGSLITAMAYSVRKAKEAGLLGDNVSVVEVRPEHLQDGNLDPMFDGLRVAEPGSMAAPVLQDERYVSGTHYTSRAAVADAARKLAQESDVSYEANALAGVGAYMEMRRTDAQPTLYVTLLSGRNATDEQRRELLEMPGLETVAQSVAGKPVREIGSALLSGTTARDRLYAPLPDGRLTNPNSYVPDTEAVNDYYLQLEEVGITLTAASQYQR